MERTKKKEGGWRMKERRERVREKRKKTRSSNHIMCGHNFQLVSLHLSLVSFFLFTVKEKKVHPFIFQSMIFNYAHCLMMKNKMMCEWRSSHKTLAIEWGVKWWRIGRENSQLETSLTLSFLSSFLKFFLFENCFSQIRVTEGKRNRVERRRRGSCLITILWFNYSF